MSMWAEVKGKTRPVESAEQITQGKRKGWWRIVLPDGKKVVVEHVRIFVPGAQAPCSKAKARRL